MPKPRRVAKGVLSPNRIQLTPKQKQEYIRLKAEGVDEQTAQELARLIAKSHRPKWLERLLKNALTFDEANKSTFDEGQHPRAKDGTFTDGAGGGDGSTSSQDSESHHLNEMGISNDKAKAALDRGAAARKKGDLEGARKALEEAKEHGQDADRHFAAYKQAKEARTQEAAKAPAPAPKPVEAKKPEPKADPAPKADVKLAAKDLKHNGKEFERQSGRDHIKAAKAAQDKADKARADGKAAKADKHEAVAKEHLAEADRAIADDKQNPVGLKEYQQGHSDQIHAYAMGGRDELNRVLASMRPALRDALNEGGRHIGNLERREKSNWDESTHPRAKDGTFGSGDGKSKSDGMSHEDHFAVARQAARRASEARAKGDQKGAQAHEKIRDDHNARGLAAEKQAVANFRPTKSGDKTRLETMKMDVARREARATRQKSRSAHLCLTALEAVTKAGFSAQFVESARSMLPKSSFGAIHQHARSSSGGQASGVNRRHASDPDAKRQDLVARRQALHDELAAIDEALRGMTAPVVKSVMPASEIHVDDPLGSSPAPRRKKPKKQKKALQGGVSTKPVAVVKSSRLDESLDLARAAITAPDAAPNDPRLLNAQRLVAGMDWEMLAGAQDAEEARARASRQMSQNLGHYDNILQRNDDLRAIHGADVDLGSGQVRELGYLGLDIFPYDYGTAIADLSMPLPFQDAEVRSFRLINTLHYLTDFREDATPFLLEIQRCLNYGGQLIYVGDADLTQRANWAYLPGLVLVAHEDSTPLVAAQGDAGASVYKQTFERVRVRVPRVYGADPEWMGASEEEPDDIMYALTAMGAALPADQAMADLITTDPAAKSDETQKSANADVKMGMGAAIVADSTKTPEHQKLLYSVVTGPGELDWDGEFMSAKSIEEMAHDAYRNRIPIKSEHIGDPIGAHLVESYIAPANFTLRGADGPQDITKGSWVVAIQFTDDQEWQKVLNGEYRGISVGGSALIEQR